MVGVWTRGGEWEGEREPRGELKGKGEIHPFVCPNLTRKISNSFEGIAGR